MLIAAKVIGAWLVLSILIGLFGGLIVDRVCGRG